MKKKIDMFGECPFINLSRENKFNHKIYKIFYVWTLTKIKFTYQKVSTLGSDFKDISNFFNKKSLLPIGFDGFLYWSNNICPSFYFWRAIEICDSGASKAASVGVLITVAPNPLSTFDFSVDIFSGNVITHLYPLTADARASPMPVFPDVASTIVSP